MPVRFALTYDYLCPFARIANEIVVDAIADGEDWDVTFVPFSLSQAHVDEGDPDVWDRERGSAGTGGVLALEWSLAVGDVDPDRFPAFHKATFDARHGAGAVIDDEEVLADAAGSVGVDARQVATVVAGGGPARELAVQHRNAVAHWGVFGVPTFIVGEEAVFVRLMERHRRADVTRVIDMLTWSNLNEFKRTRIPR